MKLFNSLLAVMLFFSFVSLNAQDKVKMTVEDWERMMQSANTKDSSLMKEVSALQSDINKLRETSSKIVVPNCDSDLLGIVGATSADVDNFRKAVNELDGKIRRKEMPKADRQNDLDALKMNRIAALPEFFNKIFSQMQNSLDAWSEESSYTKGTSASSPAQAGTVIQPGTPGANDYSYTVVKGDCLWFIAKKKEHYGSGFAWPKIYQANKEQIKDPNLIYPKQAFKIPPLTEDERAKYEKLKKNYKPAPAK